MKRLIRNPATFDLVDLYSAISRHEGYRIDVPADVESFQKVLSVSLKAAFRNPNIIHGKRVEAMFAHVLGALSGSRMIKQEDGGAAFANFDDIAIPDYRVATKDGRLLLIEVKNFHMKGFRQRFTLQRSYVSRLLNYAELNRAELKIAIYFSRVNKWVLLSPEAFFIDGRRVWIDFVHAIARNEMGSVGDRTIATLPPLTLEFFADIDQGGALISENGTAAATITAIEISCAGTKIQDETEQRIAFYLMRYGNWTATTPAKVVGGRLVSWSFVCGPRSDEGDEEDEQPFRMLGDLSSMISNAFRELTVSDDSGVVALDVKYDPHIFHLDIPSDYRGKAFPLWQFIMKPNFDFAGLTD